MNRFKIKPRIEYTKIVEDLGFNFSANYWNEDFYYRFNDKEVEEIYKITNSAYELYCNMVQKVIDDGLWSRFNIPKEYVPFIIRSWEEDDLSLYGRFDIVLDDRDEKFKILEFNADTPTSIFEASVIQWQWKEDVFPFSDQMNSIHENLVQSWKDIHESYKYNRYDFGCIMDIDEELTTTSYILSTAQEAGLDTSLVDMRKIVRNNESFYLPTGEVINCMFKLYPWEDMMEEEFGWYLPNTEMIWIEPSWKLLMSDKESLVLLHEMYPECDFLLPTYESSKYLKDYCIKPRHGREGQNVKLIRRGEILESSNGNYSSDEVVYQELVPIRSFDGRYPVMGSWIIGGEASGIGIRETSTLITDNMSNFIPHIIL